ncbi:MAG: hypothetical protein KatS3mg087_1172 [Patescibacteria group bacterium]|nr:MAG: hypothetical protein KatS3mg087_1172 [Patescibacteria group bacterium]
MSIFVNDVINKLPSGINLVGADELPKPNYVPINSYRLGLCCPSMRKHTTDEGWQIFQGLESAGYLLCGYEAPINIVDVRILLAFSPAVVALQDPREWLLRSPTKVDKEEFQNWEVLAAVDTCFKVTILKDCHQHPHLYKLWHSSMGCHAWIVYYNERIVKHLCPFVRSQHLIRTYHTVDPAVVPSYTKDRDGIIISGAVSAHYPLRQRLFKELPDNLVFKAEHPGYGNTHCYTASFLQLLSRYKVSICTASKYGYLLRKIIESTAAGCVVISDLPADDIVPEIDSNIYRVSPDTSTKEILELALALCNDYDYDKQNYFACLCKHRFNYKMEGTRLANAIENLRANYGSI